MDNQINFKSGRDSEGYIYIKKAESPLAGRYATHTQYNIFS